MYELKRLSRDCFCVDSPSRVGVVLLGNKRAMLIDAGSDKDSGKKALRAVETEGLTVEKVLVTHSHADHIGGLANIVERTGAKAFANGIEKSFVEYPILEPIYVWGAYPHSGITNKFFLAAGTPVSDIANISLGEGYEILDLYGHSFDQIGLMTPDGTAFIADALASEATLDKYGVTFIFDVKGYLNTLEKLKSLKAKVYLASHCEPMTDIVPLVNTNIERTLAVADTVADICTAPKTFDEVLKNVFDRYSRQLNEGQYSIVGASVHAYLTYLRDMGRVTPIIEDNYMKWVKI